MSAFERVLQEHRRAVEAFAAESLAAADAAGEEIVQTLRDGGTVFVCGNGGSAADAQHFAAEIVGRFVAKRRPALPSVALTTDSSILTSIANDFGYENVFARQVEALAKPGDALVGITTSGRSPNVLRAMETARRLGVRTVALVGASASDIAHAADHAVVVPHAETARVQELHIMTIHAWCEEIDRVFAATSEAQR